jgi:hypothetical protein
VTAEVHEDDNHEEIPDERIVAAMTDHSHLAEDRLQQSMMASGAKRRRIAVVGLHAGQMQGVARACHGIDVQFVDERNLRGPSWAGVPVVVATKFVSRSGERHIRDIGSIVVHANGGAGSVIAAVKRLGGA